MNSDKHMHPSGSASARRVIEIKQSVIGPTAPRLRNLSARKSADYPHVARAHVDVARALSSPLLGGPPICDELIAFVEHTFTEEEAALVRHLGSLSGKSAQSLAARRRAAARGGRADPAPAGLREARHRRQGTGGQAALQPDAHHARHLRDGAHRPVARRR